MDQSQVPEIDTDVEEDDVKIPWHFWLLVVLFGLYMGLRLIQIIVRLLT
jgi:hypothetical protein